MEADLPPPRRRPGPIYQPLVRSKDGSRPSPGWFFLSRVRLLLLRLDIGDRRVRSAVRLAGDRTLAAEVEIVVAGMAVRPHAHRAGELEHVAPRRLPGGDHPRHQAEAMPLADHRVLGDADAPADLGRGDPLVPQQRQLID